MNTNTVLSLLNHPLSMVVLGSSLGWLLVTYVWIPFDTKRMAQSKVKRYKKEMYYRLAELTTSFENGYATKLIVCLLEGKTTLNPDFKHWNLDKLIRHGWSEYAHRNIHKTLLMLMTIVEESGTTIDKEKTKKGLLLLDTLTIYLKNLQEN